MELYDECFWLFGGNVCEVDDEDCSFGDDVRGFGFKKDISGFFFFDILDNCRGIFFWYDVFFFFIERYWMFWGSVSYERFCIFKR